MTGMPGIRMPNFFMTSATISSGRENNLSVVRRWEWVMIVIKGRVTFRERNEY